MGRLHPRGVTVADRGNLPRDLCRGRTSDTPPTTRWTLQVSNCVWKTSKRPDGAPSAALAPYPPEITNENGEWNNRSLGTQPARVTRSAAIRRRLALLLLHNVENAHAHGFVTPLPAGAAAQAGSALADLTSRRCVRAGVRPQVCAAPAYCARHPHATVSERAGRSRFISELVGMRTPRLGASLLGRQGLPRVFPRPVAAPHRFAGGSSRAVDRSAHVGRRASTGSCGIRRQSPRLPRHRTSRARRGAARDRCCRRHSVRRSPPPAMRKRGRNDGTCGRHGSALVWGEAP